jgi:hypothetical protein
MNSGKYGLAKNRTYEKITSSSYATTSSYAATSSYALTASYALNAGGGGVNPTSGYIPYNNAGTFADSYISQSGGIVTIGTSTQNVLGYDGYVKLWDGNYQPTNLQAPFGGFMINQNGVYSSGDGYIRYVQNGYSTRMQMDPAAGQMLFWVASSGSAGAILTERIGIGIQNSGDVGIGKQYPNAKLDVSGSAIISGSLTVTGNITAASLKAGSGSAASFTGTPLTLAITFGTAFTNNSYAVQVTGEDARAWSLQSKSSTGFTINSNSSVALTGPVYWVATPFNS